MNKKIQDSVIIFKALADATRLHIIDAVLEEPKTVSDIVNITNVSQSCVSHQLKYLKETKIVKSERKGKCVYYSLIDENIIKIVTQTFLHADHLCEV